MADDSPTKATRPVCGVTRPGGRPCAGGIKWKVARDGKDVLTCDAHLATAIRTAGLPALVEAAEPTA